MDAILEPLFSTTRDLLTWGGVWSVLLLMVLESACIPVPSELIMLFAGYLVTKGDASFVGIVVAGVAGNVIGSVLCWAVGAYGGRPVIERYGKYVRLNHHHLDLAERFFERHGTATVFFARDLPIVRTFISLPAGIARMPLGRFTLFTFLGCVPWVLGLAWLGYALGDDWTKARDVLHQFDYVIVAAIVVAVLALLVRRRRARGASAA
ncbi:MAG: hypothetical protein JWM98_1439 [Thermoleophilia bacterium]|nr:hypothetical protein [Thermoleophilia bacterium]